VRTGSSGPVRLRAKYWANQVHRLSNLQLSDAEEKQWHLESDWDQGSLTLDSDSETVLRTAEAAKGALHLLATNCTSKCSLSEDSQIPTPLAAPYCAALARSSAGSAEGSTLSCQIAESSKEVGTSLPL
jgi:hypothetical protein